jgi:uncharacterized membrane-anchored protein
MGNLSVCMSVKLLYRSANFSKLQRLRMGNLIVGMSVKRLYRSANLVIWRDFVWEICVFVCL